MGQSLPGANGEQTASVHACCFDQSLDRHLAQHRQHQRRPRIPLRVPLLRPDLVRVVLNARLHLLESIGFLANVRGQLRD